MKDTYLINGQVYLGRRFEEKTLKLSGGKIQVLDKDAPVPRSGEVIDVAGRRVVPGFIDVHTHGGVGVDLEKLSRFFAGNGTTAWLCSVLTDTEEQTRWCINQFKTHRQGGQPTAELLGIHLEGPFLASQYKGAMPEHLLRRGDPELLPPATPGRTMRPLWRPSLPGPRPPLTPSTPWGCSTSTGLPLWERCWSRTCTAR